MFIADPRNEQFWPGKSRQVYDALTCPRTLVAFTAAEGADGHCEPKARSLYDQRMFDWLAGIVPAWLSERGGPADREGHSPAGGAGGPRAVRPA